MNITLTTEQTELLEQHLDDLGAEMRSYSGRGMYGKECLGIDLDDMADAFRLALLVSDDDLAVALMSPKFDDMGKGIIVYFPNVAVPEGVTDEDDDDDEEDDL